MQDIKFINSILFKIVYLLLWILVGPNFVTKMSQILYNSTNNGSGTVLLNGSNGNKSLLQSPEFKPNGSRDMMSSSGVFSAMVDDQTRFKDNYQLAIKRYINREFDVCFDITSELVTELLQDKRDTLTGHKLKISNDLIISIYKLYLSVSDLMLKSNPTYNSDGTVADYSLFKESFLQGCLYTQLLTIFNNDVNAIEPELFFLCFMIELSNDYETVELTKQVETYLTETGVLPNGGDLLVPGETSEENSNNQASHAASIFEKIVELYLIHILVKSKEIEKSKRIISTLFITSNEKVERYLKNLNTEISNQAKYAAALEKEQKQSLRSDKIDDLPLQSNRLNASISATESEKKKKSKLKKKKTEKKLIHTSSSSTENSILDNIKKYLLGDVGITHNTLGLINLVRPGMLIILLLSIILSYKKIAAGRYLRRIKVILLYILFKLKDTLSMAFKISYI